MAALLAAGAALAAGAPVARGAQPDDPLAYLAWQFGDEAPMGIASAWQRSTGAGVIVAVVDTGIDLDHPDLRPNLWTNPGEIPANGLDDDHDGFVDDVHGADFVGNDGDPRDGNGHGTHVAGIIAARGDNGIGVAGVAWDARLMAVRVLNARARGSAGRIAQGVEYATAHGARVINMSLGMPASDRRVRAAIARAAAAGVLVVASAGNGGRNLRNAPNYPASYGSSLVIGVAAAARDGSLDPASNYGPGAELAAPGDDIVSTARGGTYQLRSGTSMAAAFVSGVAALVAAQHPGGGRTALVRSILAGARPGGPPRGVATLDAGGALRAADARAEWLAARQPPKS
jgi:subtilisin family serine protease